MDAVSPLLFSTLFFFEAESPIGLELFDMLDWMASKSLGFWGLRLLSEGIFLLLVPFPFAVGQ